jgi:hypothetical protein
MLAALYLSLTYIALSDRRTAVGCLSGSARSLTITQNGDVVHHNQLLTRPGIYLAICTLAALPAQWQHMPAAPAPLTPG